MKKLGVLGSTGSVGSQTLEVVKAYREDFELVGILAKRASERLLLQAVELKPKFVSCYEEPSEEWLSKLPEGTTFLKGEEGLVAVIEGSDMVMNAISGTDGILPTYLALQKGKRLLASNKESLICLRDFVRENREKIVPVDSEHNALFQIMLGLKGEEIKKVYLTASGGPFRDKSLEDLKHVSVEDALKHPTWKMGAKITIDSATLMNKGMELIEAINLFDLEVESLDVVIHPQSIVHGIVELIDGSFIFHTSQTDMRIPILYSLYYPERKPFPFERKSLLDLSPITFERVDTEKFRSIPLCKWVALMGGVYPAVLVGADQIAVELFLQGRIGFLDIVNLVEEILSSVSLKDPQSLEDVLSAIDWAYKKGLELLEVVG
ncbi:1-deoxy-D-xylulose-5-phosphate reductoisomerase [Pampinifervens florentissimum]|uniref:1-deoxy-D-xylulose-5-phosphate reductoisomerase n=1 Tax=Pampinifervens florentissimum TaxID=1632019 RepID=UPI0013B47F0E|nr:1-deoxy-D-xylulose-5-phosphate reductoisomerase [Hydrogenobacter sp. T-8]QID32437.1 1-deoxy-D-xylulose-5-phosphate reductoisomerase [Hydrogenobacter sp. T-8]